MNLKIPMMIIHNEKIVKKKKIFSKRSLTVSAESLVFEDSAFCETERLEFRKLAVKKYFVDRLECAIRSETGIIPAVGGRNAERLEC